MVASSYPDGLEWVAAKLGFEERAATTAAAPMSDYTAPGASSPVIKTMIAGTTGILAVFFLTALIFKIAVKRKKINDERTACY